MGVRLWESWTRGGVQITWSEKRTAGLGMIDGGLRGVKLRLKDALHTLTVLLKTVFVNSILRDY